MKLASGFDIWLENSLTLFMLFKCSLLLIVVCGWVGGLLSVALACTPAIVYIVLSRKANP